MVKGIRLIAVLVGVALLSAAAGAGGGYAAAALHPTPGPMGPVGAQGMPGARGPAGPPGTAAQGGVCVSVQSDTDFNAIPPRTFVTRVTVLTPLAGGCLGRGTFVAIG